MYVYSHTEKWVPLNTTPIEHQQTTGLQMGGRVDLVVRHTRTDKTRLHFTRTRQAKEESLHCPHPPTGDEEGGQRANTTRKK